MYVLNVGGPVASWLVRWSPDRAVRVRTLTEDIVLCSWARPRCIERFSFERRKVIGFAITTLRDWLKKLAPLFHPIRSKTKTNRKSLALVFPRFASATCNSFEF